MSQAYAQSRWENMAAVKNICGLVNSVKLLNISRGAQIASVKCMSKDLGSSWVPKEEETHTGQKWEKDDYRLARFIETPKQINHQFAVDLIANTPPIPKTKRVVSCDGGGGPTGHPKVYINLDKPGKHACGYCGLRFYKDGSHH